MFIFLLQFIMKFADELVGKGLSPWVIGQLVSLNLAWMVVLAVPMSVLVATLMAFGGMSAHNEITAMKASGMSLYRMMAIVVIASIAVAYLLEEFDNKILPDANHLAKTLIVDIRRKKPTFTIVPGLFSQELPGYSILVKKTFEQSNDLEGITIYDYTNPATKVVVTAQRGKISFTPDYRRLIMDLENGEIHQLDGEDPNLYRRIRYTQHRIVMNVEGFDFERSGAEAFGRSDREMSASAMQSYVDSLKQLNDTAMQKVTRAIAEAMAERSGTDIPSVSMQAYLKNFPPALQASNREHALKQALSRARNTLAVIDNQLSYIRYNNDQINQYSVEIHKKYSIPVACIVFVFVGIPLGIMVRRGTFGISATLSIGFFLMYWACLIGGEKLADRGFIAPWLGMWIANMILAVLGAYLTIRIARETPRLRLKQLRRFIPRAMRTAETENDNGDDVS